MTQASMWAITLGLSRSVDLHASRDILFELEEARQERANSEPSV